MKRFGTFWKIVLLTFTVALVLITIYTGLRIYDRRFGACYWETSLNNDFRVVHYRDGRVRIFNNHTGRPTTPKLDWISTGQAHDSITVYRMGHKRGYINRMIGEIVIPAGFDHAWNFSEGLGAVVSGKRLGFIDSRGQVTLPFRFYYHGGQDKRVDFQFNEGYCTVYDSTGRQGLIDKKGRWVLQPEFDYVNNPVGGYRIVKKAGKYGVIDRQLNTVLPMVYDNISIWEDGFVVMKDGGQQKLALDAKMVLQPFIYDETAYLYYNSGKVNESGDDILLKSDYIGYRLDQSWGIMDKNGKVVARALYNEITALSNDLFSGRIGNSWISLDAKGKVVY